ncbi:MAG: energy-coupled thiamine transporter ThiT [Bacilli bacterium]|nr:energy-coupled thiamine transporter ThiT [Bacilli bacterium]
MQKKIQWMAEIAIMVALSLAFDYISAMIGGALWPNGGSISIAMVPIMVVSYRWGIRSGLLTGILVGSIQLLWSGGEAAGIVSILFDYIFAYTVVGFAGLFNNKMKAKPSKTNIWLFCVSMLISFVLRLSSHMVSSMVAYEAPFWGALTYNIGYLGISFILCSVLIIALFAKAPQIIFKSFPDE